MKAQHLTGAIIEAGIQVHRALGPGLLESAYRECMAYELRKSGYSVEKEVLFPVIYEELELDFGYRIDLLVEDTVVVELKTVERFTDVHTAQILTYLKLGEYPVGLLMNFNVTQLRDGLKRFVLD
jgi:GxxExxY protein